MDNFAQFGTGMQPQTYFPRAQQQQRPYYPQTTGAMIVTQPQQQHLQQQQALISPDRVQSPTMAAAAAAAAGGVTMATGTVETGQFENGLYTPMITAATAGGAPGQLAVVGPSAAAAMQQQQFMMSNMAGPSIAMMQPQAPPSRLVYVTENQNQTQETKYIVFRNELQQEVYVCSTLTPEKLRQNVYKQVSYYMSRSNLANDYYLIMNMDEDSFVEIAFLANFKRLRSYTNDVALITNILLDYPDEFDIAPDRTRIRPMFVLFTEIWLHDCPSFTTLENVKQLFDFYECPKFDRALPDGDNTWIVGYLMKSEAITANERLLDKKLYILDTEVRATLRINSLLSRERARELFYEKQQASMNRNMRRGYARANNEASAANQQPAHDALAGQAAASQVATNNASGTNNSSSNTSGRESCSPVANEVEDAGALPAMINMQQNQMMMQQMPVVQQPQSLLSQPVPQQAQIIYTDQLMQHQASMPPPPPPHQYPHNQYQRRMHNNHQQKHHNAAFAAAAATFGTPMNGGVGPASQQVPYLINYVAPTQVSNAAPPNYINWQQQAVANAVAAAANAQPMDFAGIIALNGLQPQISYVTNPGAADAVVQSGALATATNSNLVPMTTANVPVSAATAEATATMADQHFHFQPNLIDNSAASAPGSIVNPGAINRINYNSGLAHGGYNNREHGNRNARNFNNSTNHRRRRNQDDYNAQHQHYNANSGAPTGHFVQRQNQMGITIIGPNGTSVTSTTEEMDQSAATTNQVIIAPLSSASSSSSISNAPAQNHQPQQQQQQQQQQTSTSSASAHHAHYHHSHHHQQQHGYNKNFSGNANGNFFHGQQRSNGNYFDNAGNGRLGPSARPPPHHHKSYSNQMYRNYNNNNSHYNHNSMKNNDWQMRKSTTASNTAMQGTGPIATGVPMTGVATGIGGSMSAGVPSMASSMYTTGNSMTSASTAGTVAEAFGGNASTMPSAATAAVERFDIEQARFPPLRSTLPQSSSSSSQQQQQLTGTATTAADNATSVTATNTSSTVTVANSAVSTMTTTTLNTTTATTVTTMATASTATSSVIKNRHVSTKQTAVTNKQTTESFQNTTVDTLSASVASMSTATVSNSSSLPIRSMTSTLTTPITVNISTSANETMITSSAHSAGTVDASTASANSRRPAAAVNAASEANTATASSSDKVFVAKDKATLTDCDNDDEDEEEERCVKVVKTDRKTRNLRNGITSGTGSSANTLERRNKQKRAIKNNNGARGTGADGQQIENELGGLESQMESLALATASTLSDTKFNENESGESGENGSNVTAALVINQTHQQKQLTNNSSMAVKKTKPTVTTVTATAAMVTVAASRVTKRTSVMMTHNDEACEHVTTDDIPVVSVNETIGEDTSDSSVGGGAISVSRRTQSEAVTFPLPPSSAASPSATSNPIVRMSYAQAAQNVNQTSVPSVPSKRPTTASTSSTSSSCSSQSKCDYKRPITKENTTDETERAVAVAAATTAAVAAAPESTTAVTQLPSANVATSTAAAAAAAAVVATTATVTAPASIQQHSSANYKNKHKQKNGGSQQQQRFSKSKMIGSQANDARPNSPNGTLPSILPTANATSNARKPHAGNGSLSAAVSHNSSHVNRLNHNVSPPTATFSSSVSTNCNAPATVIENNTLKSKRQLNANKQQQQQQPPRSSHQALMTNATNPPTAFSSSSFHHNL